MMLHQDHETLLDPACSQGSDLINEAARYVDIKHVLIVCQSVNPPAVFKCSCTLTEC